MLSDRTWMMLLPAALLLAGCGALTWLAEPIGAQPQTEPPRSAPAVEVSPPRPTIQACLCSPPPGPSQEASPSAAAAPAPSPGTPRGVVILRAVGGVGGVLAGSPVGWTVAVQAVSSLFTLASRRRRAPAVKESA